MNTAAFSVYENTCQWLKSKKIAHQCYKTVGSTNDEAKAEALQVQEDLKIYVADAQTAGRGRNVNTWSNPGESTGLLSSWSYRLPSAPQAITGPIIGLHVFESLCEIFPNAMLSLKAPNDIYLGNKKILGLLVESVMSGNQIRLIIGLGLNVFSHPEQIGLASHLASTQIVNAELWNRFLDVLHNNLLLGVRECTGAHLSLSQRESLLVGLNKNPMLYEKYISISPYGDLATPDRTISWREI
jgi:BirA family biotin operon repressor/biotin-[acetyl-CoA-carboxylase] ligase